MTHQDEKSGYNLALMVYILQAMSLFLGVTALVAVIINYIKKDDVQGTWIETHFRWQIRTFWFSILWSLLGSILIIFLIGYLILGITLVWYIYRIVKGWIRLSEHKAMYVC